MKSRPILFSAPMVRAILAGDKTQTRRIVKPQPEAHHTECMPADPEGFWFAHPELLNPDFWDLRHCPYGAPGDQLWVRECAWRDIREPGVAIYAATPEFGIYERDKKVIRSTYPNSELTGETPSREDSEKDLIKSPFWTREPSIHMPRWASRITLEIVSVRVERLQEISDEDARAEGIEECEDDPGMYACYPIDDDLPGWVSDPVDSFSTLWESINGPGSWEASPWVWVVEFKRVRLESEVAA